MNLREFFLSLSTMQRMLAVSIAVHAAVLSVHFSPPIGMDRLFQDTPLQVILVNSNSNTDAPPDKAQAIAQTNLDGGGDALKGWATSPLPYSDLSHDGDDFEETQRKSESLRRDQSELMLERRPDKNASSKPEPSRQAQPSTPDSAENEEKRRLLLKQLAEIEQAVKAENAGPKRRYISPATREEAYAVYYSSMRSRVEEKGTSSFPEQNGRKLYGELTMAITINHDGRLLSTEVLKSSGNPALDVRAVAIAQAAGPFGSFTPRMRAQNAEVTVVAVFTFARNQTLQTTVQ